ncbi:hypothetical protein TEA_022681 [Camellia sinensis var. sinensis]|uniref:Uncharacterized protein n=1 Tax=Camellia sinensis var. sinensis TaxID=542762 RepID=A0A4S4EXI2_CAMSN|nr:hypothetical protein TEA_022681 [Camellia sinensis var. sinensis]
MAEKDQVVGMSATSLREQLGKAFIELEAHKGAAEDNVQWLEIEVFNLLCTSPTICIVMAEKDQVVGMSATSLREQLGKAFIELEAHKGAAEDNVQWEKEFKEKESKTCTMLADREGAVAAKEQDLLDRIQELKDAVVAANAEAWANHMSEPSELVDGGDDKELR